MADDEDPLAQPEGQAHPQVPEQLRGYLVTLVGSSTRPYNLTDATDLPGGASVELEEGKIIFRVPVRAPDAANALSTGRALAEDCFRVLAASYAPFRLDFADPRDNITRTDAEFIPDGPVPPADVAEGHLTPEGVESLDPGGQGRRAGKVYRLRLSGVVVRPVTEDLVRLERRDSWPPRLRSALSLFWAGQCSPDTQVRFVLAMAALEVLAQLPKQALLEARLTESQRDQLKAKMLVVLREASLSQDDAERVLNRMTDTRVVGARPTLQNYLNTRIPAGEGNFGGPVTGAEVRAWIGQRGGYVHSGPRGKAAEDRMNRLNFLVGMMLRWELDQLNDT